MQDNVGTTTGDIGIGFLTMQYKNTNGGGSVAIGEMAMRGVSNDKATGKYNVAIGQYAMYNIALHIDQLQHYTYLLLYHC